MGFYRSNITFYYGKIRILLAGRKLVNYKMEQVCWETSAFMSGRWGASQRCSGVCTEQSLFHLTWVKKRTVSYINFCNRQAATIVLYKSATLGNLRVINCQAKSLPGFYSCHFTWKLKILNNKSFKHVRAHLYASSQFIHPMLLQFIWSLIPN